MTPRISAFSVVKNESQFLPYGLISILPYVDEVVYFDGNSTDGTIKLIQHIQSKYDSQKKIKLHLDKDFKDFKSDYQRVFNECMKACSGDYLWYVHPDMILTNPGTIENRSTWNKFAYYVNMRSFGGEEMELEVVQGRTNKWKTIMKNDFGLHYWGDYGHTHEDMYFKEITGSTHWVFSDMKAYPYEVGDSGIKLSHFCECKPRARREQKMDTVLRTNYTGQDYKRLDQFISQHPRVSLESGDSQFGKFKFVPRKNPLPEAFQKYKEEFEEVLK